MRWTKTYIPTLRETPAEAELISHKYLMRAGYIRRLAAGVYIYLPLMQRVIDNISTLVRDEMNASGAVEISMPVLHPAELWQKSGRWQTMGKEQMRLRDRHMHDLALGGTHEEVVTSLVAGELKSYRQLPLNLYQIQTKFRDEIRPRFGLLRGREFLMKDAYSFDIDEESHAVAYQKMIDAYFRIFERCGLPVKKVESDTGAMGGNAAHEFMVPVETEGGEEIILSCDTCDYSANIEKAVFREKNPPEQEKDLKPVEEICTPNAATIGQITAFLNLPAHRFAKTLLFLADGKPIAAMIRGDHQINEIKLKNHLGCLEIEMADAATVERLTHAPVGFAGPVGLEIPIIIDPEVAAMTNFVVGANKKDAHLLHVNVGRDFNPQALADITNAQAGEGCPKCEGILIESKGVEVGNTFMLGTKYSEALGGKFLDRDGMERPYIMGSYGIGITRTAQAAVERFHDDKGIIWPKALAPYKVLVVPINVLKDNQREAAERIYRELSRAGYDVVYDDRNERAGVKLNDADLIGIPLRIAVGERLLKEGRVELKLRPESDAETVELDRVVDKTAELLKRAI